MGEFANEVDYPDRDRWRDGDCACSPELVHSFDDHHQRRLRIQDEREALRSPRFDQARGLSQPRLCEKEIAIMGRPAGGQFSVEMPQPKPGSRVHGQWTTRKPIWSRL